MQNEPNGNMPMIQEKKVLFPITIAGIIEYVTADEYVKVLEVDLKTAEIKVRVATAEREIATSFQIKAISLLNGLSEIRFALGSPQVDEHKDKEITQLKNVFESKEKDILKRKYIHFLQIYHKHVSQLYPNYHSSISEETHKTNGDDHDTKKDD